LSVAGRRILLRSHDLRQYAIAKLAESEASEQTNMSIAGRISIDSLSVLEYDTVALQLKKMEDKNPR
jgi:hypothetical protein